MGRRPLRPRRALVRSWPAPPRAQPPVWVVHGADADIVLFGSVHILPPGLDWEPPALKEALGQADDLWFEIPIDDAASLTADPAGPAPGCSPGDSLSGQLSAASARRSCQGGAELRRRVDGAGPAEPWLAEITLSLAVYRQAGRCTRTGVERQSPPRAGSAQRQAFETAEQQIGYLADAPIPDQIASLEETLGELDEGPASYERLVTAWMDGDTAAASTARRWHPMVKPAPGIYQALVVERNRRWTDAILARLQGPGEAVMVVGVGHLVGPDGVPALLRARGIAVEGP